MDVEVLDHWEAVGDISEHKSALTPTTTSSP